MSGHDSWQWQGRQNHQWFGHGTKPKDTTAPPFPGLAERIASLPVTAIASLPPSARHHAAARFEGERAATFVRAMTGWVRGRTLPPDTFAQHFFDLGPHSLGVRDLHEAAKAVGDAASLADQHTANDHLADAMRAIGLDRFHAFVRDVAARAGQPLPPLPGPAVLARIPMIEVSPLGHEPKPHIEPIAPDLDGNGSGVGVAVAVGVVTMAVAVGLFLA